MKREYKKPVMEMEEYEANEYVATCYVVTCETGTSNTLVHSAGHKESAVIVSAKTPTFDKLDADGDGFGEVLVGTQKLYYGTINGYEGEYTSVDEKRKYHHIKSITTAANPNAS